MIKIIDFYADWCVPCKQYDDMLPRLTKEYGFELEKVNVEFNKDIADQYEVSGLPTLVVVQDDEIILGTIVGAYPEKRLREKLAEIIGEDLTKYTFEVPKIVEDQKERFL